MAAYLNTLGGSSAGTSDNSGAQTYAVNPAIGAMTGTETANLTDRYNAFAAPVNAGNLNMLNQALGMDQGYGQTQYALNNQLFDQQRAANVAHDVSSGFNASSLYSGSQNPQMTQQQGLVNTQIGENVAQNQKQTLGTFGMNYYGNMAAMGEYYNNAYDQFSQQYLGTEGRAGTTSYANQGQNTNVNQQTGSGQSATPGQGFGQMPGLPPMSTSSASPGGGGGGYGGGYGSALGPVGTIPLPSYSKMLGPQYVSPTANGYSGYQDTNPNQMGQVDDQGYFMGD